MLQLYNRIKLKLSQEQTIPATYELPLKKHTNPIPRPQVDKEATSRVLSCWIRSKAHL